MCQKRKKIVTFVTNLAKQMFWNRFQRYNGTETNATLGTDAALSAYQ